MVDYVRIYEALSVECMKCGMWEETGIDDPRGHLEMFDYDYQRDHYTCNKCGSNCICAVELREYRDEE